jgi:hypothetical protein
MEIPYNGLFAYGKDGAKLDQTEVFPPHTRTSPPLFALIWIVAFAVLRCSGGITGFEGSF